MVDVIRSKTRKAKRQAYEFGLEFFRDDTPEVHEFRAYPAMDAGSLNYTLSASHKPERALEGVVRSIRKMLADDDGTPLAYRPTRYVPPTQDLDDAEIPVRGVDASVYIVDTDDDVQPDFNTELEDVDADTLYLGPDGEPHDAESIRKAMTFEAGSSRRRFAYLMDEDEELTLEADQLQIAYKRLVGKAAARPTPR